jgi:hypothetical protein
MEKQEKGQFNGQILERTLNMAVGIHNLLIKTKVSPVTRPIVNQIIIMILPGISAIVWEQH